jgi:hypothetical protein
MNAAPLDTIVRLVATPSCGGIDPPDAPSVSDASARAIARLVRQRRGQEPAPGHACEEGECGQQRDIASIQSRSAQRYLSTALLEGFDEPGTQ